MASRRSVCRHHACYESLGYFFEQSKDFDGEPRRRSRTSGLGAVCQSERFIMVNVWKVIFAALVIFGAGIVTGRLTVQLTSFTGSPPERNSQSVSRSKQRPELIDRMQQELNLSSEQRERIDQILKESRERMKKLWESVSPKADEEFKKVRSLILAELTSEQAVKYQEVFNNFGNKRRHNEADRNSQKPPESRSESEKGVGVTSPGQGQ